MTLKPARPLQPDGRLHGIIVACRRVDGRLLCIRRSARVAAPMKVCFPGGAIEVGETQEAAAVREMKEELGVDVRPVSNVWHWEAPDRNLTLWGWTAELLSETIRPEPAEVAEVLWLTDEEAVAHVDAMATNKDFVASLENATFRNRPV